MSDDGFVIDASAVLAVLLEEPQADLVEPYLAGGVIGAVNLSEVVAKLQERGMPDDAIDQALGHVDLEAVPFDEAQAMAAGKLRGPTRRVGLSLGDRACLALALARGVPAITVDRGWAGLEVGVEVVVAR